MKIDFDAPKKLYGIQAMSIFGFLHLFLYLITFVIPEYSVILLYPAFTLLYCITAILFITDFTLKRRIKNDFLLHNVGYGFFADVSIFCYIAPFYIFAIDIFVDPVQDRFLLNIVLIAPFLLFCILQALKIVRRILERKEKL